MNIPPKLCRILVVLGLALLAACQPGSGSIPQNGIQVQSISVNEPLTSQIIQTRSFDQCSADSPLDVPALLPDHGNGSSDDELTLTGQGLSDPLKAGLAAAIRQKFSGNQTGAATQETVKISIPARTRQEYTLTWRETRQAGTIAYILDGQPASAEYSYRTAMELVSASGSQVDCSAPANTAAVPPAEPATAQPGVLSDGCISSGTWKPDSKNIYALNSVSLNPNGCYNLESLGFLNDQPNLHIRTQTESNAQTSGIYTPISPTSVIEFKVFVNSLYATYQDGTPEIIFAVTPAGERLTARPTARFKLHVEDPGDKPRIHFMLADAGENMGVILDSQHYEYGQEYTIRLQLNGNQMDVLINGRKLNESLILPDGDKAFYIGYDLPIYAGADVQVRDITIDGVPK